MYLSSCTFAVSAWSCCSWKLTALSNELEFIVDTYCLQRECITNKSLQLLTSPIGRICLRY